MNCKRYIVQAGPATLLRPPSLLTLCAFLTSLCSTCVFAAQPPFFRQPDFDSQWIALSPGQMLTLSHNLGGDAADYVVNLTFQPPGSHTSWADATNRGVGGDTWFDGSAHRPEGVAWRSLTDSEVTLIRYAGDTLAPFARLRLWKTTAPDFDSGWRTIAPDDFLRLTHNLGGDADQYVVDLRFQDTAPDAMIGYHNIGEGGDMTQGAAAGAHWRNLNATNIEVYRLPQDTLCDRVRVRIWADVTPSLTTGWEPWNADPSQTFPITLTGSGPWTDYVVIMDGRAPQVSSSPYNRQIGGDHVYANVEQGYYFENMHHGSMNASWLSGESPSTEFRVRLFAYSAPRFDSGWTDLSAGEERTLAHALGGDPSDYWFDLQFRSDQASLGQNAAQLGGDTFSDTGHGGVWFLPSAQSVVLKRLPGDTQTQQLRLRAWVSAPPDFDSGFQPITPGQTLTFSPNFFANSASWVIEVRQRSQNPLIGDHCFWYGGDQYQEAGGQNREQGAALTVIRGTAPNETVEIARFADDQLTDLIRLRIWLVFNESWERFFRAMNRGEVYTINHDLGRNPDHYVVAMMFRTGIGSNATQHQIGWGGDRLIDTGISSVARGGAWGRLTPALISFWRESDDTFAEQIGVKIWSLGRPGAVEVRDHTLGRFTLPATGHWRDDADYNSDGALNVADLIAALNAGYK
ncbi:MAG: hypothetical protein Kow0059_01520 [Candidatus Sumerlaeia bacterium]